MNALRFYYRKKEEDLFKICISCLLFCDQTVTLSPTGCVDLAVRAGERTGKELFYYEASEPSQTSPGAFCFFSWCLPKKKKKRNLYNIIFKKKNSQMKKIFNEVAK